MAEAPRQPVPVFPLPELVLFPGATVPLHVFELRYRTMVRDALSRDRIIALALLAPGYEAEYEASPPFHPLGCLARVGEVEWLPNDRYNVTVVGTDRVRFERVVSEFPYRSVRVEVLPQHPYAEDDPLIEIEKRALFELYERLKRLVEAAGAEAVAALPVLASDDAYERIVNVLCMLCGRPAEERLSLLAEDSVVERGRRARAMLEALLRLHGRGESGGTPTGERN